MIYVKNTSTNPYFNLALEEYIFNTGRHDNGYLLLWQNEPSVIIGKHQNTLAEINTEYVRQNKIHVVRRLSGGGAVYHDLGNLNFTFIEQAAGVHAFDFRKFTQPVIAALRELGVPAEFNSRNDLAIRGRKFSGNAQLVRRGRILHHGTLLFDSDLAELEKALSVSEDKIESKGVKSVRDRVTNIAGHLAAKITVSQFQATLLAHLMKNSDWMEYDLTPQDIEKVRELARSRYMTWEWNYGQSPRCNIRRTKRFDAGKVEVLLNVENGLIKAVKFYGDFFSSGEVADVEGRLSLSRYERDNLAAVLAAIDVPGYFSGISHEELLSCII